MPQIAPLLLLLPALSVSLAAQGSGRFDTGLVVRADWLQANALPLERKVLQSADAAISFRRRTWAVDAGFLRVARTLSTVQGGTVSLGGLLHLGPVLFIPSVGILGGQAKSSRDLTGYNFVSGQGTGRQPRYTYTTAFTAGGGAALGVEVPVFRDVGLRVQAAQWFFSGAPLEGDRQRTLLGAGLQVRFGR
ncbi:MAG TPA: hypothetical protein VHE78_13085 [Gemmatimonadaceae bacterium]|nr:hypothetical protein [Gemmatimonadaceae bacterium]